MPSTGGASLGSTSSGGQSSQYLPIFLEGDRVAGRYRIVRFLAQGGMGEVYAAEDLELRQQVALKTVSAQIGSEPAAVERFKREIALARRVTHPNVCRIFDLGQHQAEPAVRPVLPDAPGGMPASRPITFLTMELLEGETLSSYLKREGQIAPTRALPLVRQMAAALDAAHRARVVHRDFKSENVFLVPEEDGDGIRVVVTDFGIARGSDQSDQFAAQVTGLGIVGTPAYMAPEQVENAPEITAAADLYALGIVIYEMVTGRLPFESSNPLTTAVKRLQEPAPSPHVHAPDLPVRWEQTILRCLERRPEDRFASVRQIVAALAVDSANADPRAGLGATTGAHDGERAVDRAVDRAADTGGASRFETEAIAPRSSAVATASPSSEPAPPAPALPASRGRASSASSVPVPAPPVQPLAGAAAASGPSTTTKLLALLLVVVALSAGLAWLGDDELDPSRVRLRPSVAVVGLHNVTGRAESDWVSTAVTEMVATELTRGEALRAVPGDQVAAARRQLDWPASGDPDSQTLDRLRALVGCDYVVTGSYVSLPAGAGEEQLRLDLRLLDAALAEVVTSLSEEGATGELFAMVGRVGETLRDALGVGSGGDDPLAGLPEDPLAARLYAEALDDLREFRAEAARDRLERALAAEPGNPLLHSALSSAWDALGFESQAADEAQRAFELSSGLPQEDRLLIEGRLRQARGEWGLAREVYRELWESFPDDLDYGLGLVAAEVGAGEPTSALATLDQLRRLPELLAEDPRLDLAEASAAAAAGQIDRQAQAAERAVAKAGALSAVQIHARALVSLAQAQRLLGRSADAEQAGEQAIELFDQLEHLPGRAEALTVRANARLDRGAFEQAYEGYREASEIYRRTGDRGGLAASLNNQAVVRKRQGNLDGAEALYGETEKIYGEIEDRRGLAVARNNRAVLLVDRDRLDRAMELFEASEQTWAEIGGGAGKAYADNNIAEVLRLQGRLEESLERHLEALGERREANLDLDSSLSLANLGRLRLARGEVAEAESALAEARQLAEQAGDRATQAQVLFDLGELHLARDRVADALRAHEQSLELRRQLGQATAETESRRALARVALHDGRFDDAEALAREAVDASREERRPAEEARARAIELEALLARGESADQSNSPAPGDALRALEGDDQAPDLADELQQPAARLDLLRARSLARGSQSRLAARAAADALRASIHEATSLGLRPQQLELELARARLLLDGGDLDAARAAWVDVRERATELGLELYSRRASAALAELSGDDPASAPG